MCKVKSNILAAAMCLLTVTTFMACAGGKEASSGRKVELAESGSEVTQGPILEGSVPLQSQGVITLRTPDDVIPGQIMSVQIADEALVVKDSRDCVYGFTLEGRYICKYGNRGEGPEEYVVMGAVAISPSNEVVVDDPYLHRMLFYDLNTGKFIKKTDFPKGSLDMTYACSFLSDTTAVLSRMIYNKDNRVYALANLKSRQVKAFDSVPMTTDNVGVPLGGHNVSVADGEAYYLKPFDPTIYRVPGKSWLTIRTTQKLLSPEQQGEIRDYSITTGSIKSLKENVFPGYTDIFVMNGYVFLGLQGSEYAVLDPAAE